MHKVAARAVQPFAGAVGLEPRMLAQTDDEDCEILYLLLRAERPEHVVEISPFHGWSTSWILAALRDNGRGRLVSYARHNVPADLAAGRWQLVLVTMHLGPRIHGSDRNPSIVFRYRRGPEAPARRAAP